MLVTDLQTSTPVNRRVSPKLEELYPQGWWVGPIRE